MIARYLPSAREELREAIDYFDEQRPDLGQEFADEVDSTVARILDNPLAWPKEGKIARICPTHRFQYGIIYAVERTGIVILAVMHLHRRPGYWKKRLKEL